MVNRQINSRKRQIVFERDGFTCIKCNKPKEYASLEVDHIIPIVNGGTNELNNLQTLCFKCNMDKKWNKTNESTNKLSNLSPIRRLELIKEKIRIYKDLNKDEFKIIYVLDPFFRSINVQRDDVCNLFLKMNNKSNEDKQNKEYFKYKEQRDKILRVVKDISKLSYQDIEKLLDTYGIKICFQQISKICKTIDDENSKSKSDKCNIK